MAMAHILVLDDVVDAGNMIKRILERKGHKVEVFTDEEPAVEYMRHNFFDIAILDIKLKKLTGLEVLEEVKKYSPQTMVIMLTGYPTLETAREAGKLGAKDYLVKPIDKQELEEKVNHLLQEIPSKT